MDARRAIILIGIAVISYMLVLQWNEDYGKRPTQVAEPITRLTSPVQEVDIPTDTSDADSDAPVVQDNMDAPQTQTQATTEWIKVETDVLDIRIDPVGGDIVYAALKQYPLSVDQQDVPFVLLEQSNIRTYIAQSGLVGKNGIDKKGRAQYSVEKTEYNLADGQDQIQVVLATTQNNVKIEKVFTINRGEYLIDVGFRIDNQSQEPWQANFYAQFKRDRSVDPSSMESMGMASFLGAAVTRPSERYFKMDFDDIEEDPFKEKIEGGWIAFLQHYFLGAWVPSKDEAHVYNTRKASGHYLVGYYDSALQVEPGTQGGTSTQLYLGPKDQDRLAEIAEHLDLTIDYGWLWWVAQPLFWLLQLMHDIAGNWGWAIIMLTILVKLAFFPLSAASYRSMANMRRVAPKLTAIKEQYADNREQLSKEMMNLYKKEKINPLGGCLPILVQMPVFIALYWVLMESVELRQAPFMLWIEDLSLKDPYFILPLIMGASMFVQMQLNPTPPDPMQAKVMKLMPVVFTVFFLFFPAGLVLYWVVNNLLSIAQQYYITRKIEAEAANKS
ncbi:membrane protein insertase YidC [Bermanella marisrubri]|nr:membrane protein insertase YidC [Bermanella marisrubri]QIZ85691.1 membrane protein insertase YidC [Bermanella marisrubri]